jgi:hypothetical protein
MGESALLKLVKDHRCRECGRLVHYEFHEADAIIIDEDGSESHFPAVGTWACLKCGFSELLPGNELPEWVEPHQ